jgi:hypothetical protein
MTLHDSDMDGVAGCPGNATYFLILVTILHESWGSQSWLQPAFSRRLRPEDSRTARKSRLKGGCGQDCPPHNQCRMP